MKYEDPGASDYLAGGFGAMRVADAPDQRPSVDDGTGTNTTIASGARTALGDGKLTITADKFGWTRSGDVGANGASYSWAQQPGDLNGDGDTSDDVVESVVDKDLNFDGDKDDTVAEATGGTRQYGISLSALLAKEGSAYKLNVGNHVKTAREKIETQRGRLKVLIDSNQLSGQQAIIWQKVQEIVIKYVFDADVTAHDTWAKRLPDQINGPYDKNTALGTIDSILNALATKSNLEEALDPDEDGLFVQDDGKTPFTKLTDSPDVGSGAMFDNMESQVQAWVGTTDYTRFGVWRVRRNRNALGQWQNAEMEAFAYSPLPKTKVARVDAPNYTPDGEATFEGKTVAYVGTAPYEGSIDVRVEWNSATEAIGGDVQIVLSNLEDAVNGDELLHSANGLAVREIVFADIEMTVDSDNVLDFSASSNTTTIGYMDRNQTAGDHNVAVNGVFVGSSTDGPLGVIGEYFFDDFVVGFNTTTSANITKDIRGAFGADLP